MATITSRANGIWNAAATWGTTVPGLDDDARIDGHTVRVLGLQPVSSIQFIASGGMLLLQDVAASTFSAILFKDGGGGFKTNTGVSTIRMRGTSRDTCYITKNTTPANKWDFDTDANTQWDLRVGSLIDFAFNTRGKTLSTWTTVASAIRFEWSSGSIGALLLGGFTRYVDCVFARVDVPRVDTSPGIHAAFVTNSSFNYGATFGSFGSPGTGLAACRDYNRSSGDYRVWSGNTLGTANAAMASLQSADRPASTENVTVLSRHIDSSPRLNWNISSTVASFTVENGTNVFRDSELIVNDGAELVVRGTLNYGAAVLNLRRTGRLINKSFSGTRYVLYCGTALNKSSLTADFDGTMSVSHLKGNLRCDEATAHGALRVGPGATFTVNSGVTTTITSSATVIPSGGIIVWDGATLRASVPGTPWRLEVPRGKPAVQDAIWNYGIQIYQGPAFDYWRASRESRLAYMRLNRYAVPLAGWGITTYRHATRTWSTVVDFDGTNTDSGDGHRYPAVMHDNLGFIHILYGAHDSDLRHARSNSTNSIASWTLATSFGGVTTYPQIVRTTGGTFILMYRRTDKHLWLRKSENNMNSWTTGTVIVKSNPAIGQSYDLTYPFGISLGTNSGTQRIHLFGHFRVSVGTPFVGRDPWYIRSDDGGTTWKTASGTTLTLPATPGTIGPHYRGSAIAQHGTVDGQGRPHHFYIVEQTNGSFAMFHAYHNGTTWSTSVISRQNANWGYSASYGKDDALWFGYDHTSYSTYNYATGSSVGPVRSLLAKSTNDGVTWTTQESLASTTGPNVYVPLYTYLRYNRDEDELHAFWSGGLYTEPYTAISGGAVSGRPRAVMWEIVGGMTGSDSPFVVSSADVRDSNAAFGVSVYAVTSTDSGGNTNWVFNASGQLSKMDLRGIRIGVGRRMSKGEV